MCTVQSEKVWLCIHFAKQAVRRGPFIAQRCLRVYPIKLMGDISDAGYFLSVLNILSGGPIHKAYSSGVLHI